MDVNIILGIIGLILSVVSLAYAVYVTKKSRREKKLVYEIMRPVPVAEVIKGAGSYTLKVVYEKPDEPPVYIEHAMAQYVRFSNFGKVPIARSDIASNDPLRLEIKGRGILDVSLAGVTRDACEISLGTISVGEGVTSASISFDFLDYLDGGLIQILSDNDNIETSMKGTIVGMPEGITQIEMPEVSEMPKWGCAIVILVFIIASLGASFVYKISTGSWENLWLLALPFGVLLITFATTIGLMVLVEPRKKFEFPEALVPPRWYHMRRFMEARTPYRHKSSGSPTTAAADSGYAARERGRDLQAK